MDYLNKKSDLQSLKKFEISKEDQKKVTGGFLFRMMFKVIDDTRCNLERVVGIGGNGNGDGDW